MPTPSNESELARLRALLRRRDERRSRGETVPVDDAERLARAVIGQPSPEIDHAAVQEALPGYVEEELAGLNPQRTHPELAAHLLTCPECGFLHATLLDHEQAFALDAPGPVPVPLPAPDFGQMRRGRAWTGLRTFVTQAAGWLLQELQPASLSDLEYLADVFFAKVRDLPAGARLTQPALVAAGLRMGGAKGARTPIAVQYLAATLVAARLMGDDITAARVAELRAQGQLEGTARRAAEQAAAQLELPPADRVRFADEFVRLLARPDTELPDMVE